VSFVRAHRLVLPRLALALGVLLIAFGLKINWAYTSVGGQDFGHSYVIGASILHGLDVYTAPDLATVYRQFEGSDDNTPWGVFNNPSAGIAVLPLALLPLHTAQIVFFVLSGSAVLGGVYSLTRLVAPGMAPGYVALILGLIVCAAATRWAFLYLQAAPLAFGLLGFYVVALERRRSLLALALAAVVLCLKITLGLPFIGLALLQRRWMLLASLTAIWIVANGLGFLRLGGLDAVQGYQVNMARLEQAGQANYPDFREVGSMMRLDWPYLLNAISPDLPRSDAIGKFLSGAAIVWLFWQLRRSRFAPNTLAKTTAFLGPLVCLSLLSVYHHQYDAIPLFAPAVIYVLDYLRHPGRVDGRLVALYLVPVVLFAGVYPMEQAPVAVDRLFGVGSGNVLQLIGVVSVLIAFIASLLLLNAYIRLHKDGSVLTT
jgi:hypothetical protein